MMKRPEGFGLIAIVFFSLTFLSFVGLAATEQTQKKPVIFWLSIDGLRHDYTEKSETPFFDHLKAHGLYSHRLVPIFPTLTFPTHVSKMTGLKSEQHGVTGNSFFDRQTGRTYSFPSQADKLQAETIYNYAQRAGLRTAVFDWPLSSRQEGRYRAEYFTDNFDNRMSDEQRVVRAFETWEKDIELKQGSPLQLVMAYVTGVDAAGHRFGPDSQEVIDEMSVLDALLLQVKERLEAISKKYSDEYQFYFLVTTDHGMSRVEYAVNIDLLIGYNQSEIEIVTGGNIGHVFIDPNMKNRDDVINQIITNTLKHDFATIYKREDLPKKWGFQHGDRTGDLVIVLDSYHTFNRRSPYVRIETERIGGTLGMHGYDPRSNRDMKGFTGLYAIGKNLGGREIQQNIHSLQLMPSVAYLLGIEKFLSDDVLSQSEGGVIEEFKAIKK